ncbi:MAG: hypothetical protein HRU76_13820 [Phycisphaeraceae bacterium]|nr:hypothetical protein [Phycisphaerales bacterium]QOJ18596.1 MAG: hypothetical protein HRU76_13820 [Phycisphaeraceae bacterium]
MEHLSLQAAVLLNTIRISNETMGSPWDAAHLDRLAKCFYWAMQGKDPSEQSDESPVPADVLEEFHRALRTLMARRMIDPVKAFGIANFAKADRAIRNARSMYGDFPLLADPPPLEDIAGEVARLRESGTDHIL